ncbi:MAG: hypothetical protein ABFS38_06620 [Bacteroidota bacterium]
MKRVLIILTIAFAGVLTSNAQTQNEEIDIIQSLFGMEKKAAVAAFLELEGASADAFWELYEAYETDRKALGKRRIDLLNNYAEEYLELDDAKTEEIMKETIALSQSYDKLIVKYYKKVKKSHGVKTATQFFQIESYLKSYIRTIIFSSIPFVGEIE